MILIGLFCSVAGILIIILGATYGNDIVFAAGLLLLCAAYEAWKGAKSDEEDRQS